MAQNDDDGFFSSFRDNWKWVGGILGMMAAFAAFEYGGKLLEDPGKTINDTRQSIHQTFNSNAVKSVDFPDCQNETSKTVKGPNNQTYTISCAPR